MPWPDWLVIALYGLAAGLVAVGLAIVGAAAVGEPGEDEGTGD